MSVWIRVPVLLAVFLFLFLGIAIGVDTWQFRNGSEAGVAEILSLRKESRSTEDASDRSFTIISYYPTIRYTTGQGRYFEAELADSLDEPLPAVGQDIAIRYIAGPRAQVRLDRGPVRDWLVAGLMFLVSLIFLIVALIFTRRDIPEI